MSLTCWLFLPLYFRLKLTSCYEYLGLRFHRSVRLLASGLYAFYTIGWMGNMLVAVGKIFFLVGSTLFAYYQQTGDSSTHTAIFI